MSIAAFYSGIIMTTILVVAFSTSCPRTITCPCGSSNINYTHCLNDVVDKKYTCETWAHCQTCRPNTTHCITCPPKHSGPNCTEVAIIRRKREISYGSCPHLRSPTLGSSTCFQKGNYRSCTGTCLPGYHFQGEKDTTSIKLECYGNTWKPRRNFPPCKSGGYCALVMKGAGFYNCTTTVDGTHCDITCGSRKAGRYHCYPGRAWNPRLPSCAVPKNTDKIDILTSCHCQNGGTCLAGGSCACPSGTTGSFCEIESESTGRDCNLRITGAGAYNCTISTVGTACDITCDNVSQGRYHCRSGTDWRPQLPYCTSPKESRKTRQTYCSCENGGNCDRRGRCICSSGFTGPRCENNSATYCSDPGEIPFGFYRNSDGSSSQSQPYIVGQYVNYYCRPGYDLVGRSLVTCRRSGDWSNKPVCRKAPQPLMAPGPAGICPDPGSILTGYRRLRNGTPSKSTRTYSIGQSFQYFCNQGFKLQGNNVITCTTSGQWSSKLPRCLKTTTEAPIPCTYPEQASNSRPTTPIRVDQIFPPRTELTYACYDGYKTSDPLIIYCLNSGLWSSPPPTCNRIETPISVSGTYCVLPKADMTGMTVIPSLDMSDRGQMFLPGTELKFDCEEGYELQGENWIIHCKLDGEWTFEPPTCRRLAVYCPYPGVDKNGIIEDDSAAVIVGQAQVYVPGAELRYRCIDGYVVEGVSSLVCTLEGEWSDDPPTCVERATAAPVSVVARKVCPYPIVDRNGAIEYLYTDGPIERGQVFEVGTAVKFTCSSGYEMTGYNLSFCLRNGRWSSVSPICTSISPTSGILCKDPGSIQNGGVIVYYNNPNVRRMPTPERYNAMEYPVGTRLSYDCSNGYRLEGEKILDCKSTGRWSGGKPICVEDCGRSTLRAGGKVTYGTNTTAGEFPWIVFLFMNETRQTCGGVLLDRRTVLSAAHCFVNAEFCTIYFGKYNKSDEKDDKHVLTTRSSEIIVHPEFNPATFNNDIAIVKFSPDVPFSPRIQPICMPSPATTAINIIPGRNGTVSGWGLNEKRVESPRLMMANLPVQASETCVAAYRKRNQIIAVTQGMFCAGYPNDRINACEGDSGSPLVFYNNRTQRFVVEGLVSHGMSGRCELPEKYTMFTKVSNYLQWIYQNWKTGNR
ncbi:sushi, von Willebrand factor type A, EGF and pentraxin domain-containing protein 1-like isoform X3 [Argiope bruennichi]|uniref:sushi, von Willebrand factor type A, EGF and pentraxin domain-containing protein 1-like isoform X3 n=1 Tax=Argiope bruennichi TaxID=94029 RepID=UPI0024942E17|nr:sushi, von Willebrand factor type A, EGF and pentraxin domain-containing protein 1-like isoform X3 [Argiope bruennichi]